MRTASRRRGIVRLPLLAGILLLVLGLGPALPAPHPAVAQTVDESDAFQDQDDLAADVDLEANEEISVEADNGLLTAADLQSAPLPAVPNQAQAPVALGIYRPVIPDDLSGLSTSESAMGHRVAIVHWFAQWGAWKSAFSRTDLEAVSARGSVPMITWEPWAAAGPDPAWSLKNAILLGKHDAYIAAWARGMAEYGKPVLLRFAHEMHDAPGYPWVVGTNGNTAADYVAAWKHVRAIFRQYGASNVRWVWNPTTFADAPASYIDSTYRALYPGDDEVDWIGLDIYNTGPRLDWGAPYWRSFAQALAPSYAAITAISNKPLIVPEVGSTEVGGSKAEWISQMLGSDLSAFPRLRALVWFDVDKEQPWNLDSSADALQAWLGGVGGPRFAVSPGWSFEPSA
jgi:beta-mannanase